MGWFKWLFRNGENRHSSRSDKALSDYKTSQEVIHAYRTGNIPGPSVGLFGTTFSCFQPDLSTASASKRHRCEKSDCIGDVRRGHFICRLHGTDHGPFID